MARRKETKQGVQIASIVILNSLHFECNMELSNAFSTLFSKHFRVLEALRASSLEPPLGEKLWKKKRREEEEGSKTKMNTGLDNC